MHLILTYLKEFPDQLNYFSPSQLNNYIFWNTLWHRKNKPNIWFVLAIEENNFKIFCLLLRWIYEKDMFPWNLGFLFFFKCAKRTWTSSFSGKLSLHTSTEYPRDFTPEYNSSYFLIRFQSIHSFWHLQRKGGSGITKHFLKCFIPILHLYTKTILFTYHFYKIFAKCILGMRSV